MSAERIDWLANRPVPSIEELREGAYFFLQHHGDPLQRNSLFTLSLPEGKIGGAVVISPDKSQVRTLDVKSIGSSYLNVSFMIMNLDASNNKALIIEKKDSFDLHGKGSTTLMGSTLGVLTSHTTALDENSRLKLGYLLLEAWNACENDPHSNYTHAKSSEQT